MWDDLVKQKDKWIGGKLIDYGDALDRVIAGNNPGKTTLKDIVLSERSIMFEGEEFSCGGSRDHVGLVGKHGAEFPYPENGLVFKGYGGHEFHIIMKGESDGKREG